MTSDAVVILVRSAPQSGIDAQEQFERALASAAFDLKTHVIFMGEGVWQLVTVSDESTRARTFTAGWAALPELGATRFFASSQALTERGLDPDTISLPLTLADDAALRDVLAQARCVL